MSKQLSDSWCHSPASPPDAARSERRTLYVILLTAVMMVIEIGAGYLYGSMALLADGWHMGTHVAALGISLFAYRYARRHADNPRFSFGSGKVPSLGGFASAIALGIVAVLMAVESGQRLLAPESIRFEEAIGVAVIGLLVNLVSAWMLHGGEHQHQHDHNLRAAYFHVLADALTSVLAIVALLCGKALGWIWMDALMGIVGAVVILKWSASLLRDTSGVLLDDTANPELADSVQARIEQPPGTRITDLHLWRIGPQRYAVIVSLVAAQPDSPEDYKQRLAGLKELVHITIEVNQAVPQR